MSTGFARDTGIEDRKIQHHLLAIENRKFRKKVKAKYHFRKQYVFSTVSVECQLFRGKDKFPRIKMMSLTELGKANREFILTNIKMMDKGNEDTPLYRWHVIDREKLQAILDKNLDLNIHLDYNKKELL